ncbi:MAG TPA: transglutaminase family protein [Actinomycetota bacterium]|nr:transglutaminase family protein [Actinomycetota bacterium]
MAGRVGAVVTDYALQIEHRTSYRYEHEVRNSKNEVRMTPARTPWQAIPESRLDVDPVPSHRVAYLDYFGTAVEGFEVMAPHDHLDVVASAVVHLSREPSDEFPPPDTERATEYLPASPMIVWDGGVSSLAAELRRDTAHASIRAVIDWMRSSLIYEPGSTEVGTPVVDVLEARRGVCQDYAHLCCALLRALAIPARYVSGYFAPRPLEPGESVEAESHAWVEALLPGRAWLPIDPTNDVEPAERHVKVGHGRDYTDVLPFRGVHAGSPTQTLEVGVTITRLE